MEKEKPFILVTGAAGLIGSGTVRLLNDAHIFHLVLVDDLKKGEKWKNLVGKQFAHIISRHKIFDWLKGRESEIDAVIHLGACSDTTEMDADYLLETNTHFSIRLAEWALTHNKRFIYASSAATYGDGSHGFSDDPSQLGTLKPLNMYGLSKHLVDLWMKRHNVLDRVVALKYFNVFGPNEYHKGHMASMILKMAQQAEQKGVIELYKSNDPKRFQDGEQCRDFIYVKDAAKMTVAFLEPNYRHLGGIFNIGSGKPTTWNQLGTALFDALEKPTRIHYIPMPESLNRQYQNYTCAEMDRFHKIFSKDPKMRMTPIPDAVQEYVRTYLLRSDRW